MFFSNYNGYKIEYRSGNLYQVEGMEYTVTVNGEYQGTYDNGEEVVVDGTATEQDTTFKEWKTVTDGVTIDRDSPVTTFIMPEKSVELTASYISNTTEATLNVDAPKAGKTLAETGTLTVVNASGEKRTIKNVPVMWIKVVGDKAQTVKGEAEYATQYYVIAVVYKDKKNDLIFSKQMDEKNVHINYNDVIGEQLNEYEVTGAGTLSLYGKTIKTENPTVKNVTEVNLSVTASKKEDLIAKIKQMLPDKAGVTLNNNKTTTIEVNADQADYTDISSVLNEDDSVKDGECTVTVPLKTVEDVTIPEEQKLKVNFTVKAEEKILTEKPVFETQGGTYSGTSLNVKLSCATEGAKIYYQIDGGAATEYSEDGTI